MECAPGWGKVQEKMKCASGWGNVKNFFENVPLTGEILKKLKMLKMGGTMFVYRCLVHKHGSPHF